MNSGWIKVQAMWLNLSDRILVDIAKASTLRNYGTVDFASGVWVERMISLFDSNNEADMLVNAAGLSQSVKQSLEEGVLVVIRFVQLCVTFTKHKTDLASEERREVMTYI
ncbi:hypothetical protein DAPPUDRAFT_257306 [Daphnia pulex]|uniref:Uncharacterized protein n=1 Tax=Daphnia pulex TaxID=6669 RepID=E9HDB3_DAPPU|nr:hypothetical protein DAPPUDRAFT_257306 [Daphnia pulex]|eukprot:EFX70224.1 hypothetical protein DAPPUDRAFT_257306 [Daphnia pulex]